MLCLPFTSNKQACLNFTKAVQGISRPSGPSRDTTILKRCFQTASSSHLPIQLQSPCCHAGACQQHQHSIWHVCHLCMWFIQSQNRRAFGSLQPKSCHWISTQIDDSSVFDQGWWNKTIVYSVLSQGSFSRERMLELWRTSVAVHGVFIRVNRSGILLGCASQWLFSKSYI